MKKYSVILLAAALLSGIWSCSSEEKVDNATSKALQLNTSISMTRSIIEGTNFSDSDKVELHIAGAANYITNSAAELTEGKWKLLPLPLLSYQRAGVGGYANLTNSITPDQEGDQNDILLGYTTLPDGFSINWDNPIANMNFIHVLTQLTFHFKQSNGSGHLTQIALVNTNYSNAITTNVPTSLIKNAADLFAYTATKYGLLAGKSYSEEEKGNAKTNYDNKIASLIADFESEIESSYKEPASLVKNVDIQLTEEPVTVSLLAIPTSFYANNVQLQLVIDDKTYALMFPETTWKGNQQYSYPVNIDLSSDRLIPIDFGTVTIESWGVSTQLEGTEIPTFMD